MFSQILKIHAVYFVFVKSELFFVACVFLLIGIGIGSIPSITGFSAQNIPESSLKASPTRFCINHPSLRYVQVASSSMDPFITPLSTVVEIVPSSPDDISVGDIISFYRPEINDVVMHSVVEIVPDRGAIMYRTKGFNQPPDPWIVPFSDVKGLVVAVVR